MSINSLLKEFGFRKLQPCRAAYKAIFQRSPNKYEGSENRFHSSNITPNPLMAMVFILQFYSDAIVAKKEKTKRNSRIEIGFHFPNLPRICRQPHY